MILKEYHCDQCQKDFESIIPICAVCGSKARRVFLTAPQVVTRRVAQKTDKILEQSFRQMGISNFSNGGGVNRVEWITQGPTASTVHGQPQVPVQPTFSKADLSRYGFNLGAATVDGHQYSLPDPQDIGALQVPMGAKVGEMPPDLKERTFMFGRTDAHGNVIELNGRDGK